MPNPTQVIRPDAKGNPDDIAISDVSLFRLERMDKGHWWCAVYRGEERVAFAITSKSAIRVKVTEDELICRDDSGDPITFSLNPVDAVARWVHARVTPQDWEHVQSVARLAESDDERMTALAHDIYEDGIVTEAELRAVAPAKIADAVVILARRPDETYTAYIERVASADNPLASAVKLYDLMDHLLPRRATHYRDPERRAKRERYLWALGEIHGEVVWQLDREHADGK